MKAFILTMGFLCTIWTIGWFCANWHPLNWVVVAFVVFLLANEDYVRDVLS